MRVSRRIPLKMTSDKSCRENRNAHFMFSNFFPENLSVYDTLWKKYDKARQATYESTIRLMYFAFRITKATDKRSLYVILLTVVPQRWLRERASMLRLHYNVSLVLQIYTHFCAFRMKLSKYLSEANTFE
jgi:hypothetical protein